jgi:hypothetical protein
LLLPVTACLSLAAADLQSWHGADFQLLDSSKWALRVRGEYRTGSQWPVAAQFRGGPELRYRAHPRITVIGLFHAIEGKSATGDWDEYNRAFAGVEVPLTGGKYRLTSRTAAERFFSSSAPGLARYREMLRLRFGTKFEPYTSGEIFFGRHGLIGVRPNAGFVLPLSRRVGLDIGYHFDWRGDRYGGLRHIVYTYLRFRKAG